MVLQKGGGGSIPYSDDNQDNNNQVHTHTHTHTHTHSHTLTQSIRGGTRWHGVVVHGDGTRGDVAHVTAVLTNVLGQRIRKKTSVYVKNRESDQEDFF